MRKLERTCTTSVMFTLVAFALILAHPASLSAQKRRPTPPAPPSSETQPVGPTYAPNPRTADQAAFEMQVLMSRRWTLPDLERERRRAATQLTVNLEKLAQIEADKIAPVSSAKSIDYKNLAHATAEIKDRALKIKYGLPFVLKGRGEKIRHDADAQLGSMLPELSRAIKSFIGNPALRVNTPNDSDLRSTAGDDLESIIKLSGTINKIAKTLSKTLVASK